PSWQTQPSWPDHLTRIRNACIQVKRNEINVSAFVDTKGNPNSKNLKEILSGLGISDPLAKCKNTFEQYWGAPVDNHFIKNKLDEVAGRRNQAAHTGQAQSFSTLDLEVGLRFIGSLCDTLHDEICAH